MIRQPPRRDPWSRPHGRRTLLRAGAAALGALGLAAWQQRAIAQSELAPSRFVFIYTPCGREPSWRTDTPGTGFTFCDTLKMFEPHRQHFMIVDGLTLVNFGYANFNSHFGGLTTLLGGQMPTRRGELNGEGLPASAQRTLDHLLGERLGATTPVPSIVVGGLDSNNDAGSQQVSWSAPGQPELPLHDPEQTFKTLFTGGAQAPLPGAVDTAEARRLRTEWETHVLGLTQRQTAALKGQLGSEEARHLEAYEANLADAFRRVTTPGAGAPVLPAACGSLDFAKLQEGLTSADYERTHDLQSRTLAAALACGRTRVATYSMGSHLGSMTVPGTDKQHHQHDDGAFDHYRAFDVYYGNRIKFFLDQLASYPEGDGSVLDHTLIVWTSEIGWTPSEHDHERHPVFLLGGLPGKPLKMGQYVKIPYDLGSGRDAGLANQQNRRLHELLLTVAAQMGVTDLTGFADPAFVQGPLSEILA